MADRLIPAHAGKTHHEPGTPRSLTAHPRSRGENSPPRDRGRGMGGSSPLTRGKRRGPGRTHPRSRLIPAHAGKTWDEAGDPRQPQAHPRSRGENPRLAAHGAGHPGSSPLTRGKPEPICASSAHHRLIPAHAGKTAGRRQPPDGARAHPRSRGENPSRRAPARRPRGSSPLTRGKPVHVPGVRR